MPDIAITGRDNSGELTVKGIIYGVDVKDFPWIRYRIVRLSPSLHKTHLSFHNQKYSKETYEFTKAILMTKGIDIDRNFINYLDEDGKWISVQNELRFFDRTDIFTVVVDHDFFLNGVFYRINPRDLSEIDDNIRNVPNIHPLVNSLTIHHYDLNDPYFEEMKAKLFEKVRDTTINPRSNFIAYTNAEDGTTIAQILLAYGEV